jgi:hypothetical protein
MVDKVFISYRRDDSRYQARIMPIPLDQATIT